jgi:hypothetical protein
MSPFGATANLLQFAAIPVCVESEAVIWLAGVVVRGSDTNVAVVAAVEEPMQ